MQLTSRSLTQSRRPALAQARTDAPCTVQHPSHAALISSLTHLADVLSTAEQASCHQHMAHRQKLEPVLDAAYDQLEEVFYSRRGYAISPKEQKQIEATGGSPTYGELVSAGGIDRMLQVLCGGEDMQGSTFADLGSGLGRVVLEAATFQFGRLVGVELSQSRHEQAEHVLAEMIAHHANDASMLSSLQRVEFLLEDVTCSKVLMEATHVFMCSTAFGSVACRRIVEALHDSPVFQVLITSRELPFQPYLRKLGDFSCETSWNAAGTGHVYVRADLARAPPHLLKRFCSDGGMCWLPSTLMHLPTAAQEPVEGFRIRWSPVLRLPSTNADVGDAVAMPSS